MNKINYIEKENRNVLIVTNKNGLVLLALMDKENNIIDIFDSNCNYYIDNITTPITLFNKSSNNYITLDSKDIKFRYNKEFNYLYIDFLSTIYFNSLFGIGETNCISIDLEYLEYFKINPKFDE